MPTEQEIIEGLAEYFAWLEHDLGDVDPHAFVRTSTPSSTADSTVQGWAAGWRNARPGGRRRVAAAASMVLLVGGAAALVTLDRSRNGDSDGTSPSATQAPAGDNAALADSWSTFTSPPLEPRSSNLSIGTDDGWFVWGGIKTEGDFGYQDLNDGAYFDAELDEWRVLPPAPIRTEEGHVGSGVWTGDDIVIVQAGSSPRIAAFNPESFEWRTIAVPDEIKSAWPQSETEYATGTHRWIDDKVVMFFGADPEQGFPAGVLRFDPTTNSWSTAADAPETMTSLTGPISSSNTQLFVVGGGQRNADSGCVGTTSLYVYDVASDRWSEQHLPNGNWLPGLAGWTGDTLVLAGGLDCRTQTMVHHTNLFDPSTGEWRATTDVPVDVPWTFGPSVTIGDVVAAAGPDEPVLFDRSAERWIVTPPFLEPNTTSGDTALVAVRNRLAIWSPGLERDLGDGNRACCYPTGEAYQLIVPNWTSPTTEPAPNIADGMAGPTTVPSARDREAARQDLDESYMLDQQRQLEAQLEARHVAEATGISPMEQQYVVQVGDSLFMIGRLFGVTVEVLVEYNEWPNGDGHMLLPGDFVRIPPGATYVPPCSFCKPD